MHLVQNHLDLPTTAFPLLQPCAPTRKFSWASELKHLVSRKFLNILWWPAFKFHQRHFTHSALFVSCKDLPGFLDLWRTIQKGSFAYNTLFLKKTPFRKPETELADITTLALFFGDEFIDGIASEAGKPFIRKLVQENPQRFYLQIKMREGKIILKYRFDLKRLLPQSVMQKVNCKYGISYQRFYELLQGFLLLINKHLEQLPSSKAEMAANKIADACNTCFDSFLHDVNSCTGHEILSEVPIVLQFHETKTAYMQKKLLQLRCILINAEEAMNSIQTTGWLDIMRVIQIYDDIQDVIIDDGIQDNIVLSTACHYFPEEWKWFCTQKPLLEQAVADQLLLSLYMPCSTEYCLQLASNKIRAMNWEQQKIMHYLLFKKKYVLYKEKQDQKFAGKEEFLLQFYNRIKSKMAHLPEKVIKSHAVNICVHLQKERKRLLRKLDFSTAYQLRYNLLSLPPETKAAIFDTVTANEYS